MHVGSRGFHGAQASIGSVVPSGADASHCASVGRTRTWRPGSIWATMVGGVLAYKTKKRAAQAALFLCSTLSMLDNRRAPSFTSSDGFSWRGLNELTDGHCALLLMARNGHAEAVARCLFLGGRTDILPLSSQCPSRTLTGRGCLRLQCEAYASPRTSTSAPDQDFHLDDQPLTMVGRTRSVPNLVTHAALHVRRQLNELLTAQRCALLNSAEVLVERCELDSPAFCLYFNLLETRTADQ
jgi:hypothetical protein